MDMTVKQILQNINITDIFVALSFILNFEAVVRQVAVNKGYKNVVSWCDRIAAAITFIIDVFSAVKAKKVVALILICFSVSFLSGCAGVMYKGGCGNVSSTKNTIPYTFGTAGGSALGCYFACIGYCKNPDFTPIQKAVSDYIKTNPNPNSITTSGPVVITATPINK